MTRISIDELKSNLKALGVTYGDVLLLRAGLGAIGRIPGGAEAFLDALLDVVGDQGTIVSLAFTGGSFIKKPSKAEFFHRGKKSYAGALPNAMLNRADAFRSSHPMCSYVAIGKCASTITSGHNEYSPAYEPIRKIIELNGKNMLIGCVESSPGFTTAHLAEADLGMTSLAVAPKLVSTYYQADDGSIKLFRRPDPGFCSNSFYKFYALYVKKGVLRAGHVGAAYSIIAPAKECFEIEKGVLSKDRRFNVCDSPECFMCNAGRWDRFHHAPAYILRKLLRRIGLRTASK